MTPAETKWSLVWRRQIQLFKLYLFMIASAIAIIVISWALTFVPLLGLTNEQFLTNARALSDVTVARVLFSTWCLAGFAACISFRARQILLGVGPIVEEAGLSLLGGMMGLAIAASLQVGGSLLVELGAVTLLAFIISGCVRLWIVEDFMEYRILRMLLVPVALVGVWWGLVWPPL
ncbi:MULTISPECIES: hypothetical protein [Agrobacterium]|jgi:hypothetical protein|uniref:hypothetical protein n=1 Tax=Agrobacterium tumefaciens TaxID=358 RepID=UPI001573FF21|nr:hypothetical protein [Agrobacterium tumefaciens]